MSNKEIDYDAVRRRAEKRTNEKIEFYIHLAVYIIINVVLWGLAITIGNALGLGGWATLLPLLVTLGWGIGLAIHGAKVALEGGFKDRMRIRAVRQELALEKLRLGIKDDDEEIEDMILEKPKRKSQPKVVRLTDDGELTEVDDDQRELKNENADRKDR